MTDQHNIAEPIEHLAVPIGDVKPYPRNPRRGNVTAIVDSLAVNGQYRPLVVNQRTREILAGNHTWQAAHKLKWTHIAVTYVDVDDEQAARIVAVDNRANDIATYDFDQLKQLLDALPDLSGTGYTDEELNNLLAGNKTVVPPAVLTDPDDIPDPPAEPVAKLGDVWHLGPHRVLCGDSTEPEGWEKILQGQRPTLVFTDPPYGIKYKLHLDSARAKRSDFIDNDATPEDALRVTRDALALFYDAQAHFVCCDWRSLPTIIEAMRAAAIEPKACIVWDKQSRVQNLDRYAKQHEFIIYAGPYGGQPTQCTDVWVHTRDFDPDHPTPKPVSLIEQALNTASNTGALVADAFGGSGSTLIAAHRTGRIARVVEIDPRYVDVICRRFHEHTGIEPVLAEEKT